MLSVYIHYKRLLLYYIWEENDLLREIKNLLLFCALVQNLHAKITNLSS